MTSKWPSVKLKDISTFDRGLTYAKSDETDESSKIVLRATNIDLGSGKLDLSELKYLRDSFDFPSSKLVKPGSIIICTASGSKSHLGKAALIDQDYGYAFGGFMGQLTPSAKLDPKYFYFNLIGSSYLRFIDALTDGSNINNLKFSDLGEFEFPLPPLDEQKRIVAKLDEALGDLDRLMLIENKASLESQSLSRLLMSRAFEPEDSEGINFYQKRFGDLVTLIRGPFGGSITKKMFVEKGFAVYEQKHAIRNQFSEFRYFITQEKYEELERFAVSPGDLIMSCAGTIGEVAQVPDGSPPGVINQALMLIKPSAEIHSGYIKKYLMSATFQKALQDGAKGSALKNAASVSTLKEINIPLPSLADQERIVKTLDDTEGLFAAEEERRVARKNELDRLRKAVLKSAFTGEF